MNNLENFVWGPMEPEMKEILTKEFFDNEECIYEKFNKVKEGDVVLDIGSSCGPFSYKIKDRNISKLYCVEPSVSQIKALTKNIDDLKHYEIINKAIGSDNQSTEAFVYGDKNVFKTVESIKFNTLIKEYGIKKIDFLKTDCEGGEYDIFNIENLCWLKENMKYCVGEWHFHSPEDKQKFREFRDVFMRVFSKHEVYSCNGVDIKWDLWNEHFIDYYTGVIIYIDNR